MDKTSGLPRYRYNAEGDRIDNITDWGLAQFVKAYGKDGCGGPSWPGSTRPSTSSSDPMAQDADARLKAGHDAAAKPRQLTKDAIFHYVYAALHDPIYRETYALNLKREFPRVPLHPDFWRWADWGEALMTLHIGYETVEPWPLERRDIPDAKARAAGVNPRVILRSNRETGSVTLDSETTLSGFPPQCWDYRLGNRCAIDWVLDQHKEKTPKDPTIRAKFNTYRFADYKEKVVDLLGRVARVSVETVAITEAMKQAKRGEA